MDLGRFKQAIEEALRGRLWEPPSREGRPYLYTGLIYQVLSASSGKKELDEYLKIIVNKLFNRGVGHLEGEPYSGAFMLELGMIQEFKKQAEKVVNYLNPLGEVVVLDPITYRLLTTTFAENFGLKVNVRMYHELLNEKPDFLGCKLGGKCCGGHLYFLAPTIALSMSKEVGFKKGKVICPLGWLNLRRVSEVEILGA